MIFARLITVAFIVCVCFVGSASGAPIVRLRVAFDPDVPGHPTTIKLALRINSATSLPVTGLALRLPAKMGLAGTMLGLANCSPPVLITSGLKGCSDNALIGYGNASTIVPVGSQNVHEKASLDAVMGPPAENRLEVLWFVQAKEPVLARLVLPSEIEEAKPPYGQELATTIPLVQTWPEGPDLALETFNSSIGPTGLTYHHQVNGKTVNYHPTGMKIPKTCPPGGYPFQAALTFQDNTKAANVYRIPCPRKARADSGK